MQPQENDRRYPIGKAQPEDYSASALAARLNDIRYLPGLLEQALVNLDAEQLDTPYREGGWTIRQLVHHVADSHMNAYIRFKLALTEDNPVIRPYNEKRWAELNDVRTLPHNISITLLYALHARWHEALKKLTEEDWQRTVIHPEQNRTITLWELLGTYAWHGRHHVAHITEARKQYNWNQ